MFSLKQIICYSVLLLLLACGDSNHRRRTVVGSPYSPPYGGTFGGVGAPSGFAVMVTDSMSLNVSHMQMNIFGTQGKSAEDYSGPARFQGTITFSQNYNTQYTGVHPHQNMAYPHQSYSQYPGQQCPSVGGNVPFNCQGRIYNQGNFDCQANLYGSNHIIQGALGRKRTTAQDYEILGARVYGPCGLPRP